MQRVDTRILEKVRLVLEKFGDKYIGEDNQLKRYKVAEDLRNYNEKLITELFSIDTVERDYIKKIAGKEIFELQNFTDMIIYNNYFDNSYTKYEQRVALTTSGRYLQDQEEVVLDFPYKDGVLTAGMTKESQSDYTENFFNEILERDEIDSLRDEKILVKSRRYSKDSVTNASFFDIEKDNLVIYGNNLLGLYSIKSNYQGKIKLIYIDPPYYFSKKKKEDTFKYNSNFKLSTWLTFMKNRLEVAKDLLSKEGSIWVQIADDGVGELHVLMKEIFGADNFINKITLKTKSPSGFASVNPGVFETAEYILGFAKDKSRWSHNPQYVASNYDANYKFFIPNKENDVSEWKFEDVFEVVAKQNGYENKKAAVKAIGKPALQQIVGDFVLENHDRVFRYTAIGNDAGAEVIRVRDISQQARNETFIVRRENHYDVLIRNGQEIAFYSKKVREIDGVISHSMQLTNIWVDTPYEGIAKEGAVTLKGGKKPEKLIRRIIEMSSDEGDIVLDFFAGSGTTAAVAHKLNRKYITMDQMEYGDNSSWARLQNVVNGDKTGISKAINWQGGGSFIYTELFPKNMGYLQDILDSKDLIDLKGVYNRMVNGTDEISKADIDFRADLSKISFYDNYDDVKKVLIKILEKNNLYYIFDELDDSNVRELIDDTDYEFNKSFYGGGGD